MTTELERLLPPSATRPPIPGGIEDLDARSVLETALTALGPDRLALSASFGPEDIVILDILAGLIRKPRIFTLDTGRLPGETYELIERLRARYGVDVEIYFPDVVAVEAMVRARGPNLFYESIDNRHECCGVRKVAPLQRALATVDGWVTGLRREQIATRAATPKVGLDLEHGLIWKVAPLADWTRDEVWQYIRDRDLPYNALHDQGYASIGCAPCTRAIEPGEDERAGRWWWESAESRECGIHVPGATSGLSASSGLNAEAAP